MRQQLRDAYDLEHEHLLAEQRHVQEDVEKVEPVHAAVHTGELARAACLRERGPRAVRVAVRESLPHPF